MSFFFSLTFYIDKNGNQQLNEEGVNFSGLLSVHIDGTLKTLHNAAFIENHARENMAVKAVWLGNDHWETKQNYEVNQDYEDCTLILVDESIAEQACASLIGIQYFTIMAVTWLFQRNLNIKKPIENASPGKVFIVHGSDCPEKTEIAHFIEKLGFEAIILNEQTYAGKASIHKIEEYKNIGFAIILYTPCDVGGRHFKLLMARAEQDVVFKHGYLIAKLGSERVCALAEGNVQLPTDIRWVVYTQLDDSGAWKQTIIRKMRDVGYKIDINKE
ncbi:nucleotide-binding protein [Methylovulum psychrotolerans]|uniref:TIR domain-containing protein n=1 Tax=Methylovulum psychrotolerans TaxID=1704499 RepID=UPI001BFF1D47|nr:nucleotide-binding protein [Methylovulum psychrotolerans]MBT9100128.1 nucleotide-binding protein [Methylovulum psychrotolerans]